jgi:hypothetical protein
MTTTQDMINEHMAIVDKLPSKPLTKLDALRILSNAYWYTAKMDGVRNGILYDKFGHVRRSMTLEDLKPTHDVYFDANLVERAIVNEGWNPKGPAYL